MGSSPYDQLGPGPIGLLGDIAPPLPIGDGLGGGSNWEVVHNNFAGMRNPRVKAAGGPEANPAGWQQFSSPQQGIQAISHQLDRYASGATTGSPLTTLNQIISTWAPSSDNNATGPLIDRARTVMGGVDPDQPLDFTDPGIKARLVEAMIRNEQGGNLHPAAAAGISAVFPDAGWQPYTSQPTQTAQQPSPLPQGLLAQGP
jgi:hypothetical protein